MVEPELVGSAREGRRWDGLGFERKDERFEVISGSDRKRKGRLEEENGEDDEKGRCHDCVLVVRIYAGGIMGMDLYERGILELGTW